MRCTPKAIDHRQCGGPTSPNRVSASNARLDLWFVRMVKPRLHGEAYLTRSLDDFVVCFQHRADAERYWRTMLSSRSRKGNIRWDVFQQIKHAYPLQRPQLFLPDTRIKSYAVL